MLLLWPEGKLKMKKRSVLKLSLILVFLLAISGILIYFFHAAWEEAKIGKTRTGLNNIRKAVSEYYERNKQFPKDLLKDLNFGVGSLPSEYMSKPPSNKIAGQFDGSGGWYYNNLTGEVKLNVSGRIYKDEPLTDYSNW